MSKKSFVIVARFMLLGAICAMAQWDKAWGSFQLTVVVIVFGLTNLFFLLQPAAQFERKGFSTWIFVFDTLAVSVFIFFLSRHSTELYLAYYLTIFIAAVGRSPYAAVATSLVSCAVYTLLTLYGRTGTELYSLSFAARLIFFLLTAVFIGYLAQEVHVEREQKNLAQVLLRMNTRLAVLFDISNKLVSTVSIPELYRHIIEGAARSLEADSGSLMIMDTEAKTLRVEAALGNEASSLMGFTLRVGERIAGWVAEHGNGVLLQGDAKADPKFAPYASPRPIRSSISAPLKIGPRVLGVINMNRMNRSEPFHSDDLDLLGTFANHAALVLDRVQLYRRIEELSRRDRLLGIYNRGAFDERLLEEFSRASRYNRALALIILDVDGFKAYNDQHGHQAGDEALRQVAAAIQSSTRRTDFVARYGGDEIAVILPEASLPEAMQVAERAKELIYGIRISFTKGDQPMMLTLSGGVAIFNSVSMTAADDLIRQADMALYRAKKEGRNKVVSL